MVQLRTSMFHLTTTHVVRVDLHTYNILELLKRSLNYIVDLLNSYIFILLSTTPALPKLWVGTQKWVAKFVKWVIKAFLEIFIFCHLFVKCIKILFTSHHCSRGSPLSCKAHQNDTWSCHPHSSRTAQTSHESPCKCRNVPLNVSSP